MKDKGFIYGIRKAFGVEKSASITPTVPSMPSINQIYGDGLYHNEYKDKNAQVGANTGWVYLASETIADRCASVKLRLFRQMRNGDQEEVFEHEVLDLLNNPTATMTAKQLWSLYYQYLNLTGETYLLRLGRDGKPLDDVRKLPSALMLLPSNRCQFILGDTWDSSVVRFGGNDYPISAVIRDINPDPEDMYHGMSIVRKASLTIDTDYEMKRWNNKVFKNSARPSIALEVPTELSNESYNRLRQSFDEQYVGTENAFRSIIVEGGAKINPFMMSQQDLDFLESKKFTRDEILAMFKVSPSNVGIVEDVNRANAEAQKAEFAERCVVPRLEQLCDVLNQKLLYPIYGNEYVLGYENPVADDEDRKLSIANAGVNKWFSIDEVREMYGYDPLPNGEGAQILTAINQVPLSEVVETPTGNSPTSSPEATETPQSDEPEEDTDEDMQGQEDGSKSLKDLENETSTKTLIGNAKVKEYTEKAQVYERAIQRKARKMFNEQKEEILAWLKEHEKADRHYTKKDWSDDIIDWEEYTNDFRDDLKQIFQMIIEEIGEEAFNQIISDGGFDPYTDSLEEFINSESYNSSLEINTESQKQIKATLAEGMRNQETVQQLSARVMEVFGSHATNRAFTIAQTECALAMNKADEGAWEQTGVVEAKEWFTAEDGVVCGFCHEMNGKIIPLNDDFFEKGDKIGFTDSKGNEHIMNLDYRDMGEPPLHPNCRCVLLPVLSE